MQGCRTNVAIDQTKVKKRSQAPAIKLPFKLTFSFNPLVEYTQMIYNKETSVITMISLFQYLYDALSDRTRDGRVGTKNSICKHLSDLL